MIIYSLAIILGFLYLVGCFQNQKRSSRFGKGKKKICFVHPDLGIGGAERLVVDAAIAYQSQGHDVCFYTSHHDPTHCFSETKDGTLPVFVHGDWLPRHIFSKCFALCAYFRSIYLCCVLLFCEDFDFFFCDQISVSNPLLRLTSSALIFYCHFPDQLLTQRKSVLKKLYRYPLDWLEEKTTSVADIVLVNSRFTGSIFKETFTSLTNLTPQVLYPSIHEASFDKINTSSLDEILPATADIVLLSINRYEKKKNIKLAIDSLAILKNKLDENTWRRVHLVIAGGYDPRVSDNVEYFQELKSVVEKNRMEGHVSFLRSISHEVKCALLDRCNCLLYTPDREHFGIGPVEAMYLRKMVIARNSGGPTESVNPGVTGCLCDESPMSWANAILDYVVINDKSGEMGIAGKRRFNEIFSFEKFTRDLCELLE